jgi:hypothetical protein
MLFLLWMSGVIFCPRFREHRDDNPAENLLEFHELMHQWGIHHEDVLMKMFMFSLAGDAREWYHSLPPTSISSLEQFHASFNRHCQKFYSSELICHNCCEEYKDCVQGIVVSYEGCENEGDALDELTKLVKSLSAEIEKLKADFACCSYEGNAEDIPVHETDVFGSPAYDEEVISSTDQEQPTFDEYPNEDDEEQSFSMVLVYDDYESDPWESHEGEMEELNVQFISCPEPVNEKISPGISQPASVLHPPVHSENIKRWVSNNEGQEVISYQLSFPDYKFCDPVGLYMELCFPKALEPAKLFILSSFGGIVSVPRHVFFMLSYFLYLLWIICSKEKNYITRQSGWLWWKFSFT